MKGSPMTTSHTPQIEPNGTVSSKRRLTMGGTAMTQFVDAIPGWIVAMSGDFDGGVFARVVGESEDAGADRTLLRLEHYFIRNDGSTLVTADRAEMDARREEPVAKEPDLAHIAGDVQPDELPERPFFNVISEGDDPSVGDSVAGRIGRRRARGGERGHSSRSQSARLRIRRRCARA